MFPLVALFPSPAVLGRSECVEKVDSKLHCPYANLSLRMLLSILLSVHRYISCAGPFLRISGTIFVEVFTVQTFTGYIYLGEPLSK